MDVLIPAVLPVSQGRAYWRALMIFVKQEAPRREYAEKRLTTDALMTENFAFYGRLRFHEPWPCHRKGYKRVYMT